MLTHFSELVYKTTNKTKIISVSIITGTASSSGRPSGRDSGNVQLVLMFIPEEISFLAFDYDTVRHGLGRPFSTASQTELWLVMLMMLDGFVNDTFSHQKLINLSQKMQNVHKT